MRKYTIGAEKILTSVKCNKCGRELITENGVIKEGVFSTEYLWGYFSNKDGERHSFDLCEKCYDAMTEGFMVQPDIGEENEMV